MMENVRRPVLLLWTGCALVAYLLGVASLASAAEGMTPTIAGVSVTGSTEYSATVVAQI